MSDSVRFAAFFGGILLVLIGGWFLTVLGFGLIGWGIFART